MSGRQAALGVVLSAIIAACSAGAEAMPSDPAAVATPHATSSLASVSPTPATPTLTPTPTPKPTANPTPAPVPAKPTGVKFREDSDCLSDSCYRAKFTQTVTWRAPRTKGVEIRVYGVTECLAEPAHPKPNTDGTCLGKGTPLPASVRTLLATAPASDGKVSWSWKQETGCDIGGVSSDPDGPAYFAIVLAAYNASGHSIFAIAAPGYWFMPGPFDMVC